MAQQGVDRPAQSEYKRFVEMARRSESRAPTFSVAQPPLQCLSLTHKKHSKAMFSAQAYVHWLKDEPSAGGLCVGLQMLDDDETGRWVALDCAGTNQFICEKNGLL